MRFQKHPSDFANYPRFLLDDSGNATLEFVLVVGLLIAPILNANQQLNQINQRQVAVTAIAQTIARSVALKRDTAIVGALEQELAKDANLDVSQLELRLVCQPKPQCTSTSDRADVMVSYKGANAYASQLMSETGSMLPLTLAVICLGMLFCLVGANIESTNIYDIRTEQLARFLVQEHFTDAANPDNQDVRDEAQFLAQQFRLNLTTVSMAQITHPETRTVSAKVCSTFELPIRILDFGSRATSCREAKMRALT